MNFHWLDWCIVAFVLIMLICITIYAKRYVRSISDFLAANRLAGRYLLTVSSGFGGAITLVASWEMIYNNGLPSQWWAMMGIPVGLFISLSGFVVYRFRETRALTLAQFFEMRYSRRFRLFSGFLCWLSGILNYGIFPAVTAHFIQYFFGIPESFQIIGITLYSFPLIMLGYLSIAVYIACTGGQISIMLTDFFQGIMLLFVFVIMMFFLLYSFGWNEIINGLAIAPPGQSMIDPFDTAQAKDFNFWYFIITILISIYAVRAWQGNSGYNAAARTPHEGVMAGIVAQWRGFAQMLCIILIPLAAYATLRSGAHPELVGAVQAKLAQISDPMVRNQMTVPLFLGEILPVGLTGLFAVVVIACAISCDDTYIHAWGTILIQDVIMPFRNRPLEPKQHMRLLRIAIVGIAAFGFFFSLLFPLKDFILMFFSLTSAIYIGGAGSVIIGGLYWKRGSAAGAWTAMCLGTVIGFGGMLFGQLWPKYIVPELLKYWPDSSFLLENADKFPINGQYISFIAMVSAITGYVLVSLLGPRHEHNMDRLLHRGQYADSEAVVHEPKLSKKKYIVAKIFGITDNFTRFDRVIAYCTAIWSLGWWIFFLIVIIIAVFTDWLTLGFWREFWWWKLIPGSIILGTVCTIWIAAGGIRDIIRLIKDLNNERVDDSDDGFIR